MSDAVRGPARVVRTCAGMTREGRPCRRWAMRGAPWCDLHLNAPVPCVGGPWDGDPAYAGDGLRVAWVWSLFMNDTPPFFRASMAQPDELTDVPVVGTYRLVCRGDAFTYVWERALGDGAPTAAPEGR